MKSSEVLGKVLVECHTTDAYCYSPQDYATAVNTPICGQKQCILIDNSKTDEYLKELRKAGLKGRKFQYRENIR